MRHAARQLPAWLISDVRQKMLALDQLVAVLAIAAFVGTGVFGIAAALHVDSDKKEKATEYVRVHRWGSWVSESILTERGKKCATLRNVSALCFLLVLVIGGIVLQLRQP